MFVSPFPIFRVCSRQCRCKPQKRRGEPQAASEQTEMRMEMLTVSGWIRSELENNLFLFSLSKKDPKNQCEGELSSVTLWRISDKQWRSAVTMLSYWWVDPCPDIWASQTELQINHGPWLSSVANKDKYADIQRTSLPSKPSYKNDQTAAGCWVIIPEQGSWRIMAPSPSCLINYRDIHIS